MHSGLYKIGLVLETSTIGNGIIAVVLGYPLGSIPSAYIAATSNRQRHSQMGGGNVGFLNVYREAGAKAALTKGIRIKLVSCAMTVKLVRSALLQLGNKP